LGNSFAEKIGKFIDKSMNFCFFAEEEVREMAHFFLGKNAIFR
jgi:hypothetical protein